MEGTMKNVIQAPTGWMYRVPEGVFVNDELSEKMRTQAETVSGVAVPRYCSSSGVPGVGGAITLPAVSATQPSLVVKVHEFGLCVALASNDDPMAVNPLAVSVAQLALGIAKVLPSIYAWTLAPHLRRKAEMEYVCECEKKFPAATDFGRSDGGCAAHIDSTGHTMAFHHIQPGRMVAWYALGLLKEDVEGAGCWMCRSPRPITLLNGAIASLLAENEPLLTAPKCAKPTVHAAGCECAGMYGVWNT
jgi:hypothetical protein